MSARLVETEQCRVLSTASFDLPAEAALAEEDEIADRITAQLMPDLIRADGSRSTDPAGVDRDPWLLYRRALGSYFFQGLCEASSNAAISLLEDALEAAPGHPYSLSFLGNLVADRITLGWSRDLESDTKRAMRLASRALELAPGDATVLYDCGVVWCSLGLMDRGRAALEGALDSNPTDAQCEAYLGYQLGRLSLLDEAYESLGRAFDLSPRDPRRYLWHSYLAMIHIIADCWEDALEQAVRCVALNESFVLGHMVHAMILDHIGRDDQAREALRRGLSLAPTLDKVQSVSLWSRVGPLDSAMSTRRGRGLADLVGAETRPPSSTLTRVR